MVEVITMDVAMAGIIIEVIIITSTTSIVAMIMSTIPNNMAHHTHYVVDIITPQNIASSENMNLTILWKR